MLLETVTVFQRKRLRYRAKILVETKGKRIIF